MPEELFNEGDKEPEGDKSKGTPAPLTADQVKGLVSEGLSGFSEKISRDLNTFGTQLVQAVQGNKGDTDPKPTPATSTERATQLLEDPDKVIDERVSTRVEEVIRERLAPHLLTQADDKFHTLLQQHKELVDNEYGEGTFEKHLEEEVLGIFEKLPPESKSSVTHVRTVIEQQLGKRAGELRPLAVEAERKAKERAEAPVMLHGGLPGTVQAGRLTEDDREFAKAYEKATGEEIDLKRLAEIRDIRSGEDRPWTLDDFREKKKEAG